MGQKISIGKVIPCLPAQHGFLVDSEAGSNQVYRQQIVVLLKPELNLSVKTITSNIEKVTRNNQMLRTVFDWSTGKELQVIIQGSLPMITIEHGDEDKLDKVSKLEISRLNGIDSRPPIRYLIYTQSVEKVYLVITYHHILLDGPSVNLLLNAIVSGEEVASDQQEEYLAWYDKNISDSDYRYWSQIIADLPDEDVDIFGNIPEKSIELSETRALGHFSKIIFEKSKQYKVTPASLMQSLWSEWALNFFQRKSLMYGLVLSTREYGINDKCLGPFINTLPWHILKNSESINKIAQSTQNKLLDMGTAKHIPLNKIATLTASRCLFFDIILTITTEPISGSSQDLYKVHKTHENTGFPLSIDIDIASNIIVQFTSILDKNSLDLNRAIDSFTKYCSDRLSDTNDNIRVLSSFSASKDEELSDGIDETVLLTCVSEILGIDRSQINMDKSFIINGGDSILALKLKSRLNKDNFAVNVGGIIRQDRLSDLAKVIVPIDAEYSDENADDINESSFLPATFSISSILESYLSGYESNFHEQAAFRIKGRLFTNKFSQAIELLDKDQSSLNIKYQTEPFFGYRAENRKRTGYRHAQYSDITFDQFVSHIAEEDLRQPIYYDSDEILRIVTHQANGYWYLFMSFSSLVTDGWSFSIMLERLMALYASVVDNVDASPAFDNLFDALLVSPKSSQKNFIQKNHRLINNRSLIQNKYTINKTDSKKIDKNASQQGITPSSLFENSIEKISINLNIGSILIYENGRDLTVDATNTIGPFSYLSNKVISKDNNLQSLYYVYENYPKEVENKLRHRNVKYFYEAGNWRRPLLPAATNMAVLVDVEDGDYVVTVLIRHDSAVEPSNLFSILRKELLGPH